MTHPEQKHKKGTLGNVLQPSEDDFRIITWNLNINKSTINREEPPADEDFVFKFWKTMNKHEW